MQEVEAANLVVGSGPSYFGESIWESVATNHLLPARVRGFLQFVMLSGNGIVD